MCKWVEKFRSQIRSNFNDLSACVIEERAPSQRWASEFASEVLNQSLYLLHNNLYLLLYSKTVSNWTLWCGSAARFDAAYSLN